MIRTTSRLQDAMVKEFRDSLTISSSQNPHYHQESKMTSQPLGGHQVTSGGEVKFDEQGLIVPKKIYNPCIDSRNVQSLNKEIKWNAKAGVNVLGGKSELEKAMEKRNRQRVEIEKKHDDETSKTDFQRVLAERAKRIDSMGDAVTKTNSPRTSASPPNSDADSAGDSGHCSPEPEFLRVHAQLKGAAAAKH